jgi:hypothetical protein
LIDAQIKRHLDLDTITLIDKSDNNNVIGVLKIRKAIVNGFDQSFFYVPIEDIGMLYFESFTIIQEQEDGTIIEIENQLKPKGI